jgi:hypothetical protein
MISDRAVLLAVSMLCLLTLALALLALADADREIERLKRLPRLVVLNDGAPEFADHQA